MTRFVPRSVLALFAPGLFVSALAVALLACGDDGDPSGQNAGSGGAAAAGGSAGAAGSGGSDGAAVGPTIALSYGETNATVDLGKLPLETYKEQPVVRLSNVWAAGGLGNAEGLVFDFEGDDGFRPTQAAKCPAPLPGTDLAQGYILPATRTLVWEDAKGFPGCRSVKALKAILATDP
jgi:hypothetical protein